MADRDDKSPESEHLRRLPPDERRRRFAKAITKAEFGRFYWDDELERRLRAGLAAPKGPGGRQRKPSDGR